MYNETACNEGDPEKDNGSDELNVDREDGFVVEETDRTEGHMAYPAIGRQRYSRPVPCIFYYLCDNPKFQNLIGLDSSEMSDEVYLQWAPGETVDPDPTLEPEVPLS